ncbi:MAG TPA: isoprenyl transferase [Candidatus Kryptonia bacterium]
MIKFTPDDRRLQENLKASGSIPEHIAIIMDGNGRWAKQRGLPRAAGHREGVSSVRDIVEACGQLGVKHLTLYAFSTENWKRPEQEVSTIMRLLVKVLRDETDKLHENNVRLTFIGDVDSLPLGVRRELYDGLEKTRNNTGLNLNLALSYSGRWDIAEAVRKIASDVLNGKISIEGISESLIGNYLTTAGIPDPDLLIRTSGELRISNFLLYQLAYTEIFISKVYWPEFRRRHLYDAIGDFQKRERRFGLVSEQVKHVQTIQ